MRRRRRILRAAILSLASFLVGMLAIGIPLIYLKFIPTPDLLLVGSVSDTDILVAPSLTTHVRLIDHAGSVVHRWNLADPTTGMVELMPDGSLLYFASGEPGASGTPLGAAGQGLRRVSWDGELMWAYDDGRVHHDFELLPDGTVAVLRSEPMDPGLAARVQGGAPGTEFKGQMWADQVIEIDPTTNASRVVFDATKVLDPTGDALPEWMKREEWTHANSLAYTASDPISGQEAYLISFRAISTIAIVCARRVRSFGHMGANGIWTDNTRHRPARTATRRSSTTASICLASHRRRRCWRSIRGRMRSCGASPTPEMPSVRSIRRSLAARSAC